MTDSHTLTHTPGPWALIEFGGLQIGNPETVEAVCTMWGSRTDRTDPRNSNARMIAAAPDLLKALAALQKQALQSPDLIRTEWGQEALGLTKAALTKATGGGA